MMLAGSAWLQAQLGWSEAHEVQAAEWQRGSS